MKPHPAHVRRLTAISLVLLLSGVAGSTVLAADLATLTGACEDCHGKDGASTEPKIPVIGGMSATYITDSMTAYRDKDRPCQDVKYPAGPHKGETGNMCKATENLSEDDMAQVADHFAALPFVRVKQPFDAALATHGKGIYELTCKKCHEDGGSSPDDDAGILAGQWSPYIEEQFEEYASGKRPLPEKMKPKFEKLSADDKKALVHFFASFQ